MITKTKVQTSCHGRNHHDVGVYGTCDRCLAKVIVLDGSGRVVVPRSEGQYYCWNLHKCNADVVAMVAAENAEKIANGAVMKGVVVEVVKGRKVPIGTHGKVFWIGVGEFGERVGIKTEIGTTHFLAAANVKSVQS